jgi:D-alanyl-D-alanine carboxypeptidase
MLNRFALLSLVVVAATSSYAQNNVLQQEIQSTVDSYLVGPGKKENISGIAVSVYYPDHGVMINESFFAGKTEHKADSLPIADNILFDIGSITKSYVAAIILQLEAEGKLDINDPIGKWIPEYPMWKQVTIKQLLNMTSGIPNYTDNPQFTDFLLHHLTAEFPDKFLLSFAKPDETVTPGKKYEYCNTAYILAGMIIERITNQSFADVVQSRLLTPLQLNDTFYDAGANWRYINEITFPRKAHGYFNTLTSDTPLDLTNVNLSWGGAAGAIVSTTADQIKWVHALYQGTIFREKDRAKLLKELTTLVSTKTGQPIATVDQNEPYGFGLGIVQFYEHGQRFRFYEGGTLTHRTGYLFKPCSNVTVAAGLNSNGDAKASGADVDHMIPLLQGIYKKIIASDNSLICND